MAKAKQQFCCRECDYRSAKWMGRCPDCGAWNSLDEVTVTAGTAATKSPAKAVRLADIPAEEGGDDRVQTGIGELDAVLGGGLVTGSLVLIGGDPGVGKSTLLLAAMDGFSRRGTPVVYASGEESLQQVRMRAERLGVDGSHLWLCAETDFGKIEAAIREQQPAVAVIDSVQTVSIAEVSSVPGSVAQVREVAHRCMLLAKSTGIAVLLVGHVTKSGELAGPKVLEHLVDTVLHFEGDASSGLRILRATKNRFGAVGELGLFEMVDTGLKEVPDASARLLEERAQGAPGTAVLCAMEGSRPLLAEVQALVGHPGPQTPARTCVGVDRSRVLMLVAVLQKSGLPLHDRDVFVNAAGGLRLVEPAADLAILAAIVSSVSDRPIPQDMALFGEVGLVGEVRACPHPQARIKEAARHGFQRILGPERAVPQGTSAPEGPGGDPVEVVGVTSVQGIVGHLGG